MCVARLAEVVVTEVVVEKDLSSFLLLSCVALGP